MNSRQPITVRSPIAKKSLKNSNKKLIIRQAALEALEHRRMLASSQNFVTTASFDEAYDSSGILHVAWFDTTSGQDRIRYRTRTAAGVWNSITSIDTTATAHNDASDISIAIDDTGRPGIAWHDDVTNTLRYAQIESGTWAVKTDIRTSSHYVSLAFDTSELAHVTYYRGGHLEQGVFTTSNTWTISTIDSVGDAGRGSDLVRLPGSNDFSVVYESNGTGGASDQIIYRKQSSGSWSAGETVSSESTNLVGASLTYNGSTAAVAYSDGVNDDSKLRTRASNGTWSTTLYTQNSFTGASNLWFGNSKYYWLLEDRDAVSTMLISGSASTWTNRTIDIDGGESLVGAFKFVSGTGTTVTYAKYLDSTPTTMRVDDLSPVFSSVPTQPTITASSGTSVGLTWPSVTNADSYQLMRSQDSVDGDGSDLGDDWSIIATPTTNSYTDSTLDANKSYEYLIRARDDSTGTSYYSDGTIIPGVPKTPSISALSSSQLKLDWADISSETGYKVERQNGASWSTVGTVAANVLTFTDTGLTGNTSYTYRVSSQNSNGGGSFATTSAPTATLTFKTYPGAPTVPVVTTPSPTEVDLSWTAPSGGAAGYYVERSTDNSTWSQIGSLVTTTSVQDASVAAGTKYYYQIKANNSTGNSAVLATGQVVTPLASVGGITATAVSTTEIDLSWTAVTNAASYTIERSLNGTSGWTSAGTTATTSLNDTGLTSGTTYYYHVKATNSVPATGAFSSAVNTITLPGSPTGLASAADSSSQITISWTAATGASSYKIERSLDGSTGWSQIGTTTSATSYPDSGLTDGTNHYYRVRAHNSSGDSAYSSTSSTATLLAAPTSLAVGTITAGSIALSWTDNSSSETGYVLEQSLLSDFSSVSTINLSANQTSTTVNSLNDGTRYYYRIKAVESSANSAYATSVSAITVLPAPTALTSTAVTASSVSISWTDNSDNESGFEIDRATNSGFTQNLTTLTASANATSLNDTGRSASTTYYYRVRATNSVSNSSNTSSISALTLPTAPGSPTANPDSISQVTVSWSASSGATGYKIERSPNGSSSWSEIGTAGSSATSYVDDTVDEGTAFYYRVRASNASGDSGYSTTANVIVPLATPSDLEVGTVTSTSVDLSWEDNSAAETSFIVQWSTSSSFSSVTSQSVAADQTSYTVTGLDDGKHYYFRIKASNATTSSTYATAVSATTILPAPDQLQVSSTTATSVTLTWADNSADESGFTIERSSTSDFESTTTLTAAADATTYADTSLLNGTTYFYRIKATNAATGSTFSAGTSGTTIMPAPSNLEVNAVSSSEVSLSWDDNSNSETSFKIERKTGASGTYSQIGTVGAGVTSYSDDTVQDGTKYYYRVRAGNATTDSSPTSPESAVVPLPVPGSLTADTISATSIGISWTDTSTTETEFVVDIATDSAFTDAVSYIVAEDATSYTATDLSDGTRYYFRVQAVNDTTESAFTPSANATTVLPAPTALSVANTSATSVTLTWTDDSESESGFTIERSIDSSFTSATNLNASADATEYTDTSLSNGTTYYYRIKATNTATESSTSSSVSATTVLPAPSVLTASVNSEWEVELNWTDNSTGEAEFSIERKTGSGGTYSEIDTVDAGIVTYTDTSVVAGEDYFYRVRAINAQASSSYSSSAEGAVSDAPGSLATTEIDPNGVGLTWVDRVDDETGYSIEKSTDGVTFTEITTVDPDVTSYFAFNLQEGTDYHFRVRALRPSGPSDYSNVVNTTTLPARPLGLIALATSTNHIDLSWHDASTHETGYEVVQSINGGDYETIATLAANATTYSATDLTSGTRYDFKVRAITAVNASQYSVADGDSTPADDASELTVTAVSDSTVHLAWTDPSEGTDSWLVKRSNSKNGTYTTLATLDPETVTYDDTSASEDTTYWYRVIGVTEEFDFEHQSKLVTTTTPLSAPDDLEAEAVSSTEIKLNWTNHSQRSGWLKVEQSTDGENFDEVQTLGADQTEYSVDGLEPNTSYYFRISAYSGFNAAHSNTVTAETADQDVPAPTNVTVGSTTSSSISIQWDDQSDGSSPFSVEITSDGINFTPVDTLAAGSTGYEITGLDQGKAYGIRVRAGGPSDPNAPADSSTSGTIYAIARDPDYHQLIDGYDVVDAPKSAKLISGSVGTAKDYLGFSTSPLYVYPSWLNVDDEPLTVFSGLTGFDVGDRGFSNIRSGTEIELQFDENGLTNGPGADLVLFSTYGTDPGAGGADALYKNIRSFSISTSDDEFSQTYQVGTSNFVNHTSDPVHPWMGQYNPSESSVAAQGYISTCAIDLSSLGVSDGATVDSIRVKSLNSESDLVGVGSVVDAPDIDVDSDNKLGYSIPSPANHPKATDKIEDIPGQPGKIIAVDDDDFDSDGIPDYADGFGLFGSDSTSVTSKKFVPVVLRLPLGADPSTTTFQLQYDASDPSLVWRDSAAPSGGLPDYHLPDDGSLRLWTRDGSVNRLSDRFDAVSPDPSKGYYVAATNGTDSYAIGDWNKLAIASGGSAGDRTITLWLEAVKPVATIGLKTIKFKVNPHADDIASTFSVADTVLVTPLKADLGFNNASNDPDHLRPTSPDPSVTIDGADEKYEEYGNGLRGWWSRDTGGAGFEAKDVVDLIPFAVNISQAVLDAGGTLKLKFLSGPDGVTGWVYPNLSSSSNRTQFMSNQIIASAQTTNSSAQGRSFTRGNEISLTDLKTPLSAGLNEFLIRFVGSSIARIHIALEWSGAGSQEVALDTSLLTINDITNFYSLVSARGTSSSEVTDPSVPFEYPSEGGRTENINIFPTTIVRDKHDPDVQKTLVFLHGFNVDYDAAQTTNSDFYKRLFWQGFRGNFVEFSWYGDEGLPTDFDDNVQNALYTSGSLYKFLRNTVEGGTGSGGWGISPSDVDIAAHSLGNLVMWDAIRINGRLEPSTPLVNNVTSIEAAIWSEAFDSPATVTYGTPDDPISYTAADLETMSWQHWFNPGDMNIKASLAGKFFNSYYAGDEVLQGLMRGNDFLHRSQFEYARGDITTLYGNRSASSLSHMPALLLHGERDFFTYNANSVSLAAGAIPNSIADVNIDASGYGWNDDGIIYLAGHGGFRDEDYSDIYAWWRHVFAGDGDSASSATSIGKEY